jgi:predicted DNA-binding ArsR family transcriptional regulator
MGHRIEMIGIGQALDAIDRKIMEDLGLSPEKFQELLDQIQKLLKQMEGDLSDLTKALLNNNRAELERQLREAMKQEMQNGNPETMRHTPYTRMMMRLGLDRVQSEIERFRGMLQMLGENGEDLQNVMRYLDERMRDLKPAFARDHPAGAAQAGRRTARLLTSAAR